MFYPIVTTVTIVAVTYTNVMNRLSYSEKKDFFQKIISVMQTVRSQQELNIEPNYEAINNDFAILRNFEVSFQSIWELFETNSDRACVKMGIKICNSLGSVIDDYKFLPDGSSFEKLMNKYILEGYNQIITNEFTSFEEFEPLQWNFNIKGILMATLLDIFVNNEFGNSELSEVSHQNKKVESQSAENLMCDNPDYPYDIEGTLEDWEPYTGL